MIELVGYGAAALTALGFLQKDLFRLRIISLGACLVWIVYGALLNSNSIILCNALIAVIQVTKLIKENDGKKYTNNS